MMTLPPVALPKSLLLYGVAIAVVIVGIVS
jgi:hypothetical protein